MRMDVLHVELFLYVENIVVYSLETLHQVVDADVNIFRIVARPQPIRFEAFENGAVVDCSATKLQGSPVRPGRLGGIDVPNLLAQLLTMMKTSAIAFLRQSNIFSTLSQYVSVILTERNAIPTIPGGNRTWFRSRQ